MIASGLFCSEEKGIPADGLPPSTSGADMFAGTSQSGSSSTGAATTSRPATSNPLNGEPFSQKYYTLYRKRITLPVFEYRADFMRLLDENQCIVLVGEVCVDGQTPNMNNCEFSHIY